MEMISFGLGFGHFYIGIGIRLNGILVEFQVLVVHFKQRHIVRKHVEQCLSNNFDEGKGKSIFFISRN
jgi:hypothetical protein